MTVSSAEMEFEPAFVGGMALVSFATGAFVAMVMVILLYNFLALPIWMVLLIYPVMGTVVALAVLTILYLRNDILDGDNLTGRNTKTDCCHRAVEPAGTTPRSLT